jgi:hypothetical protein
MTRRRGILYATGTLVFIVPPAFWFFSSFGTSPPRVTLSPVAKLTPHAPTARADLVELAKRDPMALVQMGLDRYERTIDAYRCTFLKQERLKGELTPVQQIEVRYREAPHTVYMLWQANADGARRAMYVDDASFVDKKGRKLARIEPNGAVARLFVKDLMLPVDGKEAQKASRRAITDFGFRSTLNLLETYNAAAAERGVLDLRYVGTGEIAGRPTFVIVRDLPYETDPEAFPDARMVLHLDQEWLLPVAVYSYADHEQEELLGSYVYTDVEFNPDFSDEAFTF